MRFQGLGILGVVLALGCGCAKIPEHEVAKPLTDLNISNSLAKAIESGEFQIDEWKDEKWWERFEDPVFTRLIEEALVQSPTLKRMEARLKAAVQVAIEKDAARFPELSVGVNDNWQHLSANGLFRTLAPTTPAALNEIIGGFSLSYEFDFWGRNRSLFEASFGKAAAIAAESEEAKLMLTTSIAYSYFQLQYLMKKAELLKGIEENSIAIESINAKKQDYALNGLAPVLESAVEALGTRGELLETCKLIELEKHRLKALAGLSQDAELDIPSRALTLKKASLPPDLGLDLISRRPDLVAQKWRMEVAAKEVGAARTDFYPNINLAAFAGLDSLKGYSFFRADSLSMSLLPAVNLPIFTAGRLEANLMDKIEQFNEAVFAYNELIYQVAKDVSEKITLIRFLDKQLEAKEISTESLLKVASISQKRFEGAISDRMSYLQSQNVALQAMLSLTEMQYAKQIAICHLIRSIGGGYHD